MRQSQLVRKHIKLYACILFLSVVCSHAYGQFKQRPQIPDKKISIKEFGAVGDDKTLNTEAIQKALNSVKETGGVVSIPKGVFLCGPLTIYGKTNLQIEKGAVLKLRNDVDSFPAEKERYLNFITVSKASDVKISGEGTIDGQGALWWEKYNAKEISFRRPQMIFVDRCERIEIAGITTLNPPNTHISLKGVNDVYIHDITIQAPPDSRNTDGINISAKNCTIENCSINTGDDNIAINFGNKNLNSSKDPECKNILIKKCFFGHGHGLSIGSYTSGGLDSLNVQNCRFDGTTSGIRIKTGRGRGGTLQNISYTDIEILSCKWPIYISEYYPKEPRNPQDDTSSAGGEFVPVYNNISLKNITVTGASEAVKLWGLPDAPIQNISFENVSVTAKMGLQINNVRQAVFRNCIFNIEKGEKLHSYQANITGL